MRELFNSRAGRVVLHLLAYGLAAGAIAAGEQAQLIDFGAYQMPALMVLGAALDALRKFKTSL